MPHFPSYNFFGTPVPNFAVNNDRILDNLRVRQPNTFKAPPASKILIDPNVGMVGDNNPATNDTLRSGVAQAGALVYATEPIINSAGPGNPPTDGCFDGRNHLYFSDGDQWIPLSNCLPEPKVDSRCLGKKVIQKAGRCQVPYVGFPSQPNNYWVTVDNTTTASDSQSFVQFIVPPGSSPSYVTLNFSAYLAQRELLDAPPADKVLLGAVVQTKIPDPTPENPENESWPLTPPSQGDATPALGARTTVYQRSYTNLQALANPFVAEMSGQVVNCEWTLDLSDYVNKEIRVWIVTKSSDEEVFDIRNYIWIWGQAPLGSLDNTFLAGYEDIDAGPLPVGFASGSALNPLNSYPPLSLTVSQPPSNVEIIV